MSITAITAIAHPRAKATKEHTVSSEKRIGTHNICERKNSVHRRSKRNGAKENGFSAVSESGSSAHSLSGRRCAADKKKYRRKKFCSERELAEREAAKKEANFILEDFHQPGVF